MDGRAAHRLHLVPGKGPTLTPEQTARRNQLETALENLRQGKSRMDEEEYYTQLEPILVELARLYQTARSK